MAYAATVTGPTEFTVSGRRYQIVTVAETQAASTSEYNIPGIFPRGVLVSIKSTLTAGTGTTINPKLGVSAAFTVSTQAHLATQGTTAAHINDQTELRYSCGANGLYVRSTPNNAAADHSISTELLFAEGWEA